MPCFYRETRIAGGYMLLLLLLLAVAAGIAVKLDRPERKVPPAVGGPR